MKRRSFIGGILASIGLLGASFKAHGSVPQSEDEFYNFFKKFNGYPINDNQKLMYRAYKEKWNHCSFNRRLGVSTFMITLAAYESYNGKRVVHFSSNRKLSDLMSKSYDIKVSQNMAPDKGIVGGRFLVYRDTRTIDFVNIDRNTFPLRGLRYDVGLFDESGRRDDYFYKNWVHFQPLFKNSVCLSTVEY